MGYEIKGDKAIIRINPAVYALQVVYGTAYFFLDKAYVMLDGDPNTEIIVTLSSKSMVDLNVLAGDFMNELIRFGFQHQHNKETMALRTLLMKRVLLLDDKAAPVFTERQMTAQADKLMDTVFKQ